MTNLSSLPASTLSELKSKLLAKLYYGKGTIRCMCPGGCLETEPSVIDFDHADDTGNVARETFKDAWREIRAYRKAHAGAYPQGLRTLCANCNNSRSRNHGKCHHEQVTVQQRLLSTLSR
jgi:hypothetical protein